ncbi:FliM/FliN family flagellar motor switch protein [Stenotrophomonas sp. PD6]|uniref:FliM/FliN family flagellar motor switch protein n=1 Tax=Stenotrophomonas sp. PD6 TaxID=3368612 RepID=UPI003BA37DD0
MSAQRWPFSTVSPATATNAAVSASCARMGLTPQHQALPARGAMLRFDVSAAVGELRLAVAADDWCPTMLPELAELAWSELIDRATLACWLPERPLLDMPAGGFADARISLCDVVPVAALNYDSIPRPTLQTAQGPAWILHASPCANLPLQGHTLRLRMPVDLAVARFTLPLQRLRTLAPGAVVLVDQLLPVARSGRHRLYTFDFTLETISVTTSFDFLDEEDDADLGVAPSALPPAGAAVTAAGIDVARLPITVDVVLCQLQQSVADLAALQPGTVFDLPPDAWKQLQLRVNGQLVARGELVQVGEQLGIQLHQAPLLP